MMEKRVGIVLDLRQIKLACEAYAASRLLPDEEATATLCNADGAFTCEITVTKKRVRKPKKNGAQA